MDAGFQRPTYVDDIDAGLCILDKAGAKEVYMYLLWSVVDPIINQVAV